MTNVVLVRPEGEENVGATARAMMNMDVSNLIIIDPQCNYRSEQSLRYSVHAMEILENTRIENDLEDIINEFDISVAMTRRIGQWRKRDFQLSEFSEFLKSYEGRKIGLIFGNEASGLSNDEIIKCDVICAIPSSPKFPSLNLSHSVMITLYELYKINTSKITNIKIASREEFDKMIKQIFETFHELGFFRNVPEIRLKNYINKILIKSKLDIHDTRIISNIFKKIKGMVKKYKNNAIEKKK